MTAPGGVAAGRRVSAGLLWVGGGLAVYGASSFVFLAFAGHALGQGPAYTALALMWTLLNALGIGLYLPVEQETGRSIAARRALDHPTAAALRVPVRYAAATLAAVALVVALTHRQLTDLVFDGVDGIVWLFVLALVGMALAYLARGVLAGTGRFPRYGLQLAVDGALRVGGIGALALAGSTDARAYGLVLGLAPLVSTGLALVRPGRILTHGAGAAATTAMTPLVLASLTSQALANAGPVAAQLLKTPAEADVVGNLVNALTVARVPLFLFAAVQAVFLPRLAQHVARGERPQFVAGVRTATVATVALGLLGIAATAVVGPEAVRLLFGATFDIARLDVTILAVSSALFMVVQVLVQGLLARGRDAWATLVWALGLAAFLVSLTLPLPLATLVPTALTVGSAASLAAAAVALRRTLAEWSTP